MLIQRCREPVYILPIFQKVQPFFISLTENDSKGKNVTISTKGIKHDTRITTYNSLYYNV